METGKITYDFVLAGKVNDANFHKCWACLKALQEQRPKEVKFEVLQFFETQWEEYLTAIQLEKKGPFFHHKPSAPIVFMNDVVYIGDSETFLDWALNEFRYVDQTSAIINKKRASDAYRALIDNTPGRHYAFFDVNVGGDVQKVVIELFSEFAPKTCENFLKICKGDQTNAAGEKLTYVGTEFHRIVKGMYIQGGDISKLGVKKGASIYNGEFADESYHIKHTEVGLIGMCKRKGYAHTNESQFYITTAAPLSFMDTKYVVFGRVISGMRAFKIL